MDTSGYKDGAPVLQAILKTPDQNQTITFHGTEEQSSSAVCSSDVIVEVGATDHTSGSSAITTRNITNYPWDHHYLSGSLVAAHCSGDYLAYAIKAPQKLSGMVRIINRKTGDRGLVKNIRGMVRDLAFAHITQRIILAFTDYFGTLYVCEVTSTTTENTLNTEMLLEVSSGSDKASDNHRVIWCPYIPDEQCGNDDGDDPAYLLVLTHGQCAEIWNINMVLREYGRGVLHRDRVLMGHQQMEQHSAPITDAAFSPDGTALATAALDGFVMFFQVYMADEEKSPRCLHQWNPHDGKPLSSLFFLDNHKHHSPEVQFWKYAVTGACNNSELRVWSCESWQCHQTLRFVPATQDPPQSPLAFKAAMDPSANFLLLSDIHRRVMYVVIVYQDSSTTTSGVTSSVSIDGGTSCVGSKNGVAISGSARLVSVSELPVQYPALSLAITDAAWKPYKRWKHDHAQDHAYSIQDDDDDDDGDSMDVVEGVVMRCVLINTKSLQEAILRFQPSIHVAAPSTGNQLDLSASQDSIIVRDGLTDLSMNLSSSVSEVEATVSGDGGGVEDQPPPPPPPDALTSPQTSSLTQQPPALQTPPANQPPMNLLTPDSFSSPRKPEDSDTPKDDNEEGVLTNKVTPTSKKYDVPYNSEFENAALSLLLRRGSGTLMQSGDSENGGSLNILGSVVAGTSKSPPATALPPPPSASPPTKSSEEAPLATSEVAAATVVGRGGASSTSSPSLEVQQILHSQNGKGEDYGDEDEVDIRSVAEIELAEDDDDVEEEEEEPEALRQNRSHPQPPPFTQMPHVKPQPPPSAQPKPESQPMPQPPSSLPQPPSSLPQPPPSMTHSSPSLPQLAHKGQLPEASPPQKAPSQLALDLQQAKLPSHDVDLFASVKSLPSQLTCAQLEAEIKSGVAGTKSPSTISNSLQQSDNQGKRGRSLPLPHNLEAAAGAVPEGRRSTNSDPAHVNGPINPGVSAADIAELRKLMMTYEMISREQSKEMTSLTLGLTSKLDKALQQVNQLAKQVEEIKAAQSQVQMQLPHVVTTSLRPVMEATLRSEIRNTVLPGVVKSMEPLRSHVSQEVHSLVRSTEGQVVDAVTKVVHSRGFIDNLGGAMSSVVGSTVQNSCRDAHNKLLLPGLNAVTQQIFTQVNENFSRGTREYLQNVESEVQSCRTSLQETYNKAAMSLTSTCSNLGSQAKLLQENVKALTSQQNTLSESLCERVKGLVREEVTRALQEHQASVDARSRAHTPAPSPHTHNPKVAQQQVQALISAGQFNAAFKQALSASDLSLVVFVCERVNPQQVFNMTPCPLTQDVLLSLVNQLSHDLSTFTDLKMKYLEEAVMNLDSAHPVTREHMRPVLQGFQRNLHNHLSANPNHKKVKMLLMAVNHLVAV